MLMFTNLYCTLICKHTLLETDDSAIFTCSFFFVLCVCLSPRIHKIRSDFFQTWIRKLNKSYSVRTSNFKFAGSAAAPRPLDVFWVPGTGDAFPDPSRGCAMSTRWLEPHFVVTQVIPHSSVFTHWMQFIVFFPAFPPSRRHWSRGRQPRHRPATAQHHPHRLSNPCATRCWEKQLLKHKELYLIK